MIYINKEDYKEIIEYAKSGFPNEACGLLGGIVDGDIRQVEKVYYLTNIDASMEHFSMDPKEQFAAIKDMRANELDLIGNFHSHPKSPARPSEEDKRLAYDSKIRYLILSLLDMDAPVLKGFEIENGNVTAEEIVIRKDADYRKDKSDFRRNY